MRQAHGTLRPDVPLLIITAALAVTGLVVVYSASFVIALVRYGDPNYFIVRQAIWACLGLILMAAAVRTDYRRLRPLAVVIMGATIAALIAVLVIGTEANGARRWLGVGQLTVQPAEFAKLAVIVYLGAWLEGRGRSLTSFEHGFLPFMFIIGSIAALILLQPNLGTTFVIVLVTVTMFWVAGASIAQMMTLVATGGVALVLVVLVADYRADRLMTFFNAELDPQGHGFQTLQSLIAIGNGGVTGLGLGASRSKFFYIPESHTDGVFAILAEEAGLVAAFSVLLLFILFLVRGYQVAHRAPDQFGRLVATGITTWLTAQAMLNIGGIMRVIPLTGVPLPFLSYGGSALAAELLAVGLLLSISRYARQGQTRAAPSSAVGQHPKRRIVRRGAS